MIRRRRRKLTGREAVRALAGGVHDPDDLLWARLVAEVEDEDRLDELVRRVSRWHRMGTLPDPD